MLSHIKCLPVHPYPISNESISFWMEKLAKANKTLFAIILEYIIKSTREHGFIQALSSLTGVPKQKINQVQNDFKSNFWENSNLCPIEKCGYRSKEKAKLNSHLANKHNLGVIWHDCPHCDYKSKHKNNLKKHMANIHDIGVNWYKCPHCDYRAKENSSITCHLASVHDIDVKWQECPLCEYKAKLKPNLTKHLANIHDIGVKWYECPHCEYRTKCSSNLKRHIKKYHPINQKLLEEYTGV